MRRSFTFARSSRSADNPTWRNWSGEQTCNPAVVERPRNLKDVQSAVQRAVAAGRRVKAVGSGHSFTGAALTDGTLIDLSGMPSVIEADGTLVRVPGGMRLHDLSNELAAVGLAMENLGDIDAQTVAGAISTGTHGTGATLGNIPSQVAAVQLVTATGDVLELGPGNDPDGFRAARVSVGALGVITAVTLRCQPAYVLRGVDTTEPRAEILATLHERAAATRHFEVLAFPYADRVITRTNTIADGPPRPASEATRWVRQKLLETWALEATCRAGRRFPAAIPRLNRGAIALAGTNERVDRSDRVFASPRDVHFVEMEYALPAEAAVPAVREVLALIEDARMPINLPIEVRFVAGDDALLSPAYGRDTLYIAVHAYQGMAWDELFRAVEALALGYGGRPHWGKRHFRTAADLETLYPEWDRFAAVRARLDPGGVFSNDYTDRVLGPVAATVSP